MRTVTAMLLTFALSACRRPSPSSPDAARAVEPDAFAPGAPRGRAPSCRPSGVSWFARPASGERFDDDAGVVSSGDAGDPMYPAIESVSVSVSEASTWALWTDARDRTLRVSRSSRSPVGVALGAGNRGDVLLALAGPRRDVPIAVWTYDTPAGRAHSVRSGDALESGCEQPESRDEALAVSAAVTSQGVLVAWDDGAPAPAGGNVKVQVVPVPVPRGVCAPPRQVSPPDQDAGDPLVVSAPDGGAVLFWLSARELERDQNNSTATDVWGTSLDASGAPRGGPLRVTVTQGNRFGLGAAVSPDGGTVWLTWRVVPESGTEARGDGGSVALARIARTPTGLTRVGDPVVMTAPRSNPTGTPRVFAFSQHERPVEVWWLERRSEAVTAVHRAADAPGRPAGEVIEEPCLHGELPAWMDARGTAGLRAVRTPGGGVGVARFRCGVGPR